MLMLNSAALTRKDFLVFNLSLVDINEVDMVISDHVSADVYCKPVSIKESHSVVHKEQIIKDLNR